MKEQLAAVLSRTSLAYRAVELARKAMSDVSVSVSVGARLPKSHFERTYSLRATHLAELGKRTWNFEELLAAVRNCEGETVRVHLIKASTHKVLIVMDEIRENLVGCAAFER